MQNLYFRAGQARAELLSYVTPGRNALRLFHQVWGVSQEEGAGLFWGPFCSFEQENPIRVRHWARWDRGEGKVEIESACLSDDGGVRKSIRREFSAGEGLSGVRLWAEWENVECDEPEEWREDRFGPQGSIRSRSEPHSRLGSARGH
jgi:hypothetical protein